MVNVKMRLTVIYILMVSCFLGGCKNKNSSSLKDISDKSFLNFGEVFPVDFNDDVDFSSPHEVSTYAVNQCVHGNTDKLLNEMPQVDEDEELCRSFQVYIEEFGNDLEQFRDKDIFLKFYGYSNNESISVWYYYITNEKGDNLQHSPWVSLHRSNKTQRCALTGIFLFDAEAGGPGKMPDNIMTSLKD